MPLRPRRVVCLCFIGPMRPLSSIPSGGTDKSGLIRQGSQCLDASGGAYGSPVVMKGCRHSGTDAQVRRGG